jgi:hypothetical protein
MQFRLGRSIAQILPFHRIQLQQEDSIITKKILIIMAVIAIAKIAVLVTLW